MKVLCPKHKTVLFVQREELVFYGKRVELVLGRCEHCKTLYVNNKLFSSSNSFTYDNKEYEFLEDLTRVSVELTTPNVKIENILTSNKEASALKRKKKLEEKRVRSIEHKEYIAAYEQRLLNEKSQAKHDAIIHTRNRLLNNSYKEYHVKKVYYMDNTATCNQCGDELIKVERVVFTIDGIKIKTSGLCCVRCNSAFLSGKIKNKVESELANKKAKDIQKAANNKTVINSSSIIEKQMRKIEALAKKPGPQPLCIRMPTKHPTEITTAKLKGNDNREIEITIVRDECYQQSSKNIYWQDRGISRAILKAIATGNPWVWYKEKEYMVISYSQTALLSESIGGHSRINSSQEPQKIWIYKAKTPCPSHPDRVESVTAFVLSVEDHLQHPINVSYCNQCNKYYINSTSFNLYSQKYGMPLIELYNSAGGGYGNYTTWSEESILHFLGYNVNSTDNLSDEERQRILTQAIEAGHINKPKVIVFLETMIRLNERQEKKTNAVTKWRKDLKYISDYKLEKQRSVYGEFKRKR